jgi:hypothetical protein
MKNLLVFVALCLASTAQAASILVYRGEPAIRVTDTQYRVSTELGRAWVVIHTWNWEKSRVPYGQPQAELRAKVDGLSYDAATSSIVFKGAQSTVTCATVTADGRKLWIRPTSACTFRQIQGLRTIDDGFDHVTQERVREVYLDVAE